MAGRAGERAADRLVQSGEQGERAGAFGRVGDAHHHAARLHRDAAAVRDLALAQLAAHVVAQGLDLSLGDRGAVDLHEHMGAALQIETEHDRADGQE